MIDKPVGQYAFKIPLATWTDVAWFHALIDRVGLYVGIEWMSATYEPLAKVSPRLEREEQFHADTTEVREYPSASINASAAPRSFSLAVTRPMSNGLYQPVGIVKRFCRDSELLLL